MKTSLYHIQLNVSDAKVSLSFYKDLLGYLGYRIVDESEEHLGAYNGSFAFWIIETEKKYRNNKFHRKNTGINHIALRVSTKEEVDQFVNEFLKPRNIEALYNGPKEHPEYKEGYYAVFLEDPDKIKLEVAYIP